MAIGRNIQQGLRSLSLHKLRTFLSALGVVFGVTAVIAMLSIGEGAKMETLSQIEKMGMNTVTIKQNELSDEQFIRALEMRSKGLSDLDVSILKDNVPHLKNVTALKIVETTLNATNVNIKPEILSVADNFNLIKNIEMEEGRFLCSYDYKMKSHVCVLGHDIAKKLGKDGHVGRTIRMDQAQFLIVGVTKNKNWKLDKVTALTTRNFNESVFIPLGIEMGLSFVRLSPKAQSLSEIILQFTHSEYLNSGLNVIKRILEKNHEQVSDYQIIVPQALMRQAYQTQYTFNLVLGGIAAISLLVGGIGIMNIMLATVSERTHEIGIRRALGANKSHIMLQFLTESLLLTLIGAFLGIAIGVSFSHLISFWAGWHTIVTYWSILVSIGMASFVGICSGLYPAFKAARMNPIAALRS
jgi:putative ABC transport system permease protein